MDAVINSLRDAREAHLEKLKEWLRIPSVSTDPRHRDDVRAAGEFVETELKEAGWSIRKDDEGWWEHFCPACAEDPFRGFPA